MALDREGIGIDRTLRRDEDLVVRIARAGSEGHAVTAQARTKDVRERTLLRSGDGTVVKPGRTGGPRRIVIGRKTPGTSLILAGGFILPLAFSRDQLDIRKGYAHER